MHKICKFSLKKFFYSVLILELIIFQDVQFFSDVHCAQTVNRMLPRNIALNLNKKVKRKQNQNQNPTEYQPQSPWSQPNVTLVS